MRARMAVAVSGVKVELREVLLRDKPAEMLEKSAKGTVPVLVVGDRVIDESLDVMQWALAYKDPEGWLAHIDHELISANDGPFKQALDRYKYPHRFDLADGIEHRAIGLDHLTALDKALSAAPFLAGQQGGFTDIALFPFIRQFAATDNKWFDALPLPKLQAWLASLTCSALFETVMVRHPQWKTGAEPNVFP